MKNLMTIMGEINIWL